MFCINPTARNVCQFAYIKYSLYIVYNCMYTMYSSCLRIELCSIVVSVLSLVEFRQLIDTALDVNVL